MTTKAIWYLGLFAAAFNLALYYPWLVVASGVLMYLFAAEVFRS